MLLAALFQQPRNIGRLQRQEQVPQHGVLFTGNELLDLFRVAFQLFVKSGHEFGDVIAFKHGLFLLSGIIKLHAHKCATKISKTQWRIHWFLAQ